MFFPQENEALAGRADRIPFSRGVEAFQSIVNRIVLERDLNSADIYRQVAGSVANEISYSA
jgi:hypothetical protein